MTSYDLTDEVKAIGSLNIEGNITPVEWFSHIRLPNNKPDLISIILLSDIVYWYRPTTIRDELSGKIIGYKKKFKSDLLQKGYKDLETFFGLSKDQIKKSLQRLEQLNLIKRIFRNIKCNGSSLANVMFIQIFPINIINITERTLDMGINTQTSEHSYPGVRVNIPTPPGINTHTYTDTTPNISTNNSLSLVHSLKTNSEQQPQPESLMKTKRNERENEMLKIWNEVVEEKNETTIKLTTKREQLLDLRLKEFFNNDISVWEAFCKKIASSKFLMGEVTNFKVQLDWALKEENILKIIENSYVIGDRLVGKDINSAEVLEEVINDPIWRQAREELKRQLGEGVFKSWISKLSFQTVSENMANFIVPTKFIKEWIISNYSSEIKRNFIACGANIQGIFIQVAESK